MAKKISKKHKKLLKSSEFKDAVTEIMIDLGLVKNPRGLFDYSETEEEKVGAEGQRPS